MHGPGAAFARYKNPRPSLLSTFNIFHSSPNEPTPAPPRIALCAVDAPRSDPPSCTNVGVAAPEVETETPGVRERMGSCYPSISHSGLDPPSTLTATLSPSRVALAEIRA